MFHTILSYYDVFIRNNDLALTKARDLNGIKADVRSVDGTEYVDRIYSTNPYDYLNPNYYPFTRIENDRPAR